MSEVVSGLSRQNTVYRRMIAVCDQVADAALHGADPIELTRVFAGSVHKRVVLLDTEFGLRAEAGGRPGPSAVSWAPTEGGIDLLLRTLRASRRPLRVPAVPDSVLEHGCLATPVAVGDSTLGYLLVLDETGGGEPDDVDLLIVSYAATLFALTLAHERTSTELGLRYRGAVVDALVAGHFLDSDDARRKATSLGLTDSRPFRIGVIRSGPPAGGGFPLPRSTSDSVVGHLSESALGVIAVARGPEIVVLVPEECQHSPDGALRPGQTSVMREFGELWGSCAQAQLSCGLSEPTSAPELAPHAFRQAEQAIDLGIRLGRGGQVVAYDDLGIYRLLLRIGEMPELWRFADDVLGAVISYDATHKLDLVHTLSVYLTQHGSLKQAARTLRVHANTVAYRVQRIEQLTKLDLGDSDDRLLAHVAVKIVESWRRGERAAV
jgi:hypothetical protein